MNNDHFVSALRQGDPTAFKELVEQYQHHVYNTGLGILQNEEDAEDVAQDVFIQVFQSIAQFKGDSKLSTWIYRITISKSLEFIRRKRSKKRFGFVSGLLGNEYLLDQAGKKEFYHPGVAMENRELSAILFRAINQLPENQRIAFILHKIEQISYQEVAEVMQVSLSSVESLMFRARQNLQKSLGVVYKNYEG